MKARISFVASVLIVLVATLPATAQKAGDLDTSFGNSTTGVAVTFGGLDHAIAVTVDSQGRVLAVGYSDYGGSGEHWALTRYLKNGLPDATFGTGGNGQVLTSIAGRATAVTFDSQGRVVVAGSINNGFDRDFGVARFNPDGSSDTTFGTNLDGKEFTKIGTGNDLPGSVVIDGQGRIIVGGFAGSPHQLAIARYDGTTGVLDTSFNSSGVVTTTFGVVEVEGSLGIAAVYNAIAQDEILIAGTAFDNINGDFDEFGLALFKSDGTPETSFGTGGIVRTKVSDSGLPWNVMLGGMTVDSNNRIVVVGNRNAATEIDPFVLARYLPTGNLDTTSFCCGGYVVHLFAQYKDHAGPVAVDQQGNIVAWDTKQANDNSLENSLVRFKSDGQLDTSFGSSAMANTVGNILGGGIALDSDGNIMVAATNETSTPTDTFLLARYFSQSKQADLKITKSATSSVVAGGNITYTISVSNAGPDNANTVVVTDPLPANTTFVANSCNSNVAATCSLSGGTLTITYSSLPNGSTSTTTFQATVASGTADNSQLTNTATVSFNGTDPDPSTNSASASTLVVNRADLSVTNTASPANVLLGGTVTYTITITNNGPAGAPNLAVAMSAPAGVTFTSCSTSANCNLSPSQATITAPLLANGNSVVITITGTLNSGSDGALVVATATAGSSLPDPNSGNNSASATFTVNNKADLAVGIAATKLANRQISYLISVKNGGPYNAGQVQLTNAVPSGTTLVSLSPGSWSCTAPPVGGVGTITCNLPSLAVGATQNLTLVVKASSGTNTVTDTANVSSATYDPNSANNSVTLTTKAGQ